MNKKEKENENNEKKLLSSLFNSDFPIDFFFLFRCVSKFQSRVFVVVD